MTTTYNPVEQTVLTTTNNVLNTQKDFSNFTAYNNELIIYAAAVCIGFATKDMISDIMNEAILPLLVFITKKSFSRFIFYKIIENLKDFPVISLILEKIAIIIWIVIVWIVILWLTYLVFTKLIKIDIISRNVNFIQDIIKYAIRQEQPANKTSQ